jgi:formyltetrahydrofolate-dependent phosphoribosylglycinamide formyltransferase
LVTLLAVAAANTAVAQEEQDNPFIDISVGETYTGQLMAGGDSLVDGSWFEMFLFAGTEGDTVTISITSIDFNAHLFLADSLDTILETDDDSGGECNPHLTYVIPASGRYIVYATSTYRDRVGHYELSVLPGTVPPASSKRCGGFFDANGTIGLGETVEGTLGPPDPKLGGSHYQIWELDVPMGDTVTVDFKSGDFDAFLVLYRGFATAIATNDDGGGACHARLVIAGSGFPLKAMLLAVLASGGGTNLQALLDTCRGSAPALVVLVECNRPDAGALDRARKAAVDTHIIADPADGPAMIAVLQEYEVELVVLAGYLKLIPEDVVAAYDGRMINIHPALLPAFGGPGMYGMRVHRAVLESGATVSGPTVHLVNAEYDRGQIVAQWPVPVAPDDTPETLQKRVLAIEHQILPAVVLNAALAGGVTRLLSKGDSFQASEGNAKLLEALYKPNDK